VEAAQGLELGLLIGTDHIVVGSQRFALPATLVQIKDPGGPGREVGVAGKDPGPVLPWLDRIGVQPASHRGRGDRLSDTAGPYLGGQLGARPPRQRETGLGGQRAGQRLDLGHLHRGEPAWASRPGQVLQPRDAVRGEPSAPLTHRVHADPQIGGGRCVRAPGGRGQHDPSPDHVAVGTTPGPGTGGQHRDLQLGKHNHERAVDPHASLSQPTPPPEEGDTPMAPRLSARR